MASHETEARRKKTGRDKTKLKREREVTKERQKEKQGYCGAESS